MAKKKLSKKTTISRPKKSVTKPKKKTATKKSTAVKKLPPKVKVAETKAARFDSRKYVRIASTESADKFKVLGEKVQKKELKWAFFATENSIGMHYYLIL